MQELHEDYLFPQENGNHAACEWLTVFDDKENGWRVEALEHPFSFNASYYTVEELTECSHAHDLKKSGNTLLHLDYKQSGCGSHSCGPKLAEKWQFNDSEFTLSLLLQP